MMLLKTKNLKFIIKTLVLLFLCQPLFAQDGNTNPKTKFKVDGVAGVVGDYLILESDIDKFLFDIKSQGQSSVDITPCQVMGKLLEDKLLAHHAIQDSIVVNDAQINSEVDQICLLYTSPSPRDS